MKKKLRLMGLVTLIAFPLVALILHYIFYSKSFILIFETKSSLLQEILIGLTYGLMIGYIGVKLLNLDFFDGVEDKYAKMLDGFKMNIFDILFISICAGVGEEILFRGVIQPLIGVIITSILFVAIHGYLNPKKGKELYMGFYLVVAICGIGFISEKFGIVSAIIAHSVYDFIILKRLV